MIQAEALIAYRQQLREILRERPRNIGIVRELVQVNILLDQQRPRTKYISELYRRSDWIAETN